MLHYSAALLLCHYGISTSDLCGSPGFFPVFVVVAVFRFGLERSVELACDITFTSDMHTCVLGFGIGFMVHNTSSSYPHES